MKLNRPNSVMNLLAVTLIVTITVSTLGALAAGYSNIFYFFSEGATARAIVWAILLAPIGAVIGFGAGISTLKLGYTKLYGFEWFLITSAGLGFGCGFYFGAPPSSIPYSWV